jgi:xylulokinase
LRVSSHLVFNQCKGGNEMVQKQDELLLGIDIGTQGTKVVVIDLQGNVHATSHSSYDFQVPKLGWSQQNPLQWWEGVKEALQVLWEKRIDPKKIQGIGVSGQMHSLVLLNEKKQELGPAILWNDVRTMEECDEIQKAIGQKALFNITRNSVLPGFTAPKLMWIRKHEPERYALIRYIMQPKDYIVFKLSGTLSCDVSDASGTSLFNVNNRQWSEEILKGLNIPSAWLPDVHESQTMVGKVSKEAGDVTGLSVGIPIVAGAGDNAAAALGNGIYEEGKGIVSIGTSGTVFAPLKSIPSIKEDNQLRTLHLFCHCLPDTWHAMGVTLSAGMSLRWFKDTFSNLSYDELLSKVEQIPAGSEGLIYLPYLNGERTPHNDPNAKGLFFGMNYRHSKHHFTRAVLEGVSFSLRDCLELIKKVNISLDTIYVTGGANKSSIWRQILSEVMNHPMQAFEEREGPAYGAALLAGLGVGVWTGPDQFPAFFESSQKTHIDENNVHLYESTYLIYRELYERLKPVFGRY